MSIFSVIKENFSGESAKMYIIAVVALLLYKILGIIGVVVGLVVVVVSDILGTSNLKEIYNYIKEKITSLKS